MENEQLNSIFLKPRFTLQSHLEKGVIIKKFVKTFNSGGSKYMGKVVDQHVVIDVPEEEAHFWSPQLQLEIEAREKGCFIKGLFGPKPQIWSFFMFVHFGVALAFMVFLVWAYTRWNLNQPYKTPLVLTLMMPVLWIVLYVLGRLGRKRGHEQMLELDKFLKETLKED